ncbi:MAG: hypothetical protein ABI599_06990 [Flavobacteriales bacterium]
MNKWDAFWWVLVGITFFLVGLVIGFPGQAPHPHHAFINADDYYGNNNSESGGWLTWKWFWDWLPQLAMAVFALMLYFVTRNQRRIAATQTTILGQQSTLLSKANETAIAALKESEKTNRAALALTEKSINVLIESERGRLIGITASFTPDRKCITFTVRNTGKALVIRRMGILPYPFVGIPMAPRHSITGGVSMERSMAHMTEFTPTASSFVVPRDCQNPDGTIGSNIIIEARVGYRTLGQRRILECAWIHFSDEVNGVIIDSFLPHFGAGFQSDDEVTTPSQPGTLGW